MACLVPFLAWLMPLNTMFVLCRDVFFFSFLNMHFFSSWDFRCIPHAGSSTVLSLCSQVNLLQEFSVLHWSSYKIVYSLCIHMEGNNSTCPIRLSDVDEPTLLAPEAWATRSPYNNTLGHEDLRCSVLKTLIELFRNDNVFLKTAVKLHFHQNANEKVLEDGL